MTNIKPRNDNVLVLPDGADTMKGKLWIPDSASKAVTRGTIVATGPGYLLEDGKRQPLDLEEGDRVEFHLMGGEHLIQLGAEDPHVILKEIQVLAVIENEPVDAVVMPHNDFNAADCDPSANLYDTESDETHLSVD